MWTYVAKNGQNQYLLREIETLFLRPARELIFSMKYFPLNVLTGTNHPHSGENFYVEKNYVKLTKNRFFRYGILTTCRLLTRFSSTVNVENNYDKIHIAKN